MMFTHAGFFFFGEEEGGAVRGGWGGLFFK